jgi:electron transport complex protein RnfC
MIETCGGMPEGDNKVLAGGPMMGKAVSSLDTPVCKGTNSITVLTEDDARRKEPQPCIRCAKCVSACPMGLEPYLLSTLSVAQEWERCEKEEIVSCISCGSCQFTCPAYRRLLDDIRKGKGTVMGIIRSRNAPAPAPAAKAEAPKAKTKDGKEFVMHTAEKPFVTPTDLDFSGKKANPVPHITCGPKPAVLPKGWPA